MPSVRVAGAIILSGVIGFVSGWYGRPPDAISPIPPAPGAPQAQLSTPRPAFAIQRYPEDPKRPEQRAIKERARAIQQDAGAIRNECRTAAGGDWDRWERDTAKYRATLKEKVDRLKPIAKPLSPNPESRYEALAGLSGFPLFEVGAREHLRHLIDSKSLDQFTRERVVVAARRWLENQGIDLVFVPAPKLTELYAESFFKPCPFDGIIAPHVRHALLHLLDEDVETVDVLRKLQQYRDSDSEYLCNAADTHWGPRAIRIIAKEVAERIERYRFGARSRYGTPIVNALPGPFLIYGAKRPQSAAGWCALDIRQQEAAEQAQPRSIPHVTMLDGSEPPDDPESPVLVIGNSYVVNFREQLIRELNMLVQTRAADDATTEAFSDFLRDPGVLAHVRVVVWVTTEQHMTEFKPLPKPIMDTLKPAK